MVTVDLSGYRWHTGAALTRVDADERCPLLFRDLGPLALARHLRAPLQRLAGPLTPLLYMRTADWTEPYTDHEDIGRLVFLAPHAVGPWHSGVPGVYVASAEQTVDPRWLGYVPGGHDLTSLTGVRNAEELREALGSAHYDGEVREARARLDALNAELEQAERAAEPLRCRLRSRWDDERKAGHAELHRRGLTENDLCAAWHHLPRERRQAIKRALEVPA